MIRWELAEFKAKKTNKNILSFEADILIPDEMYSMMYRPIKFIYDGQRLMVNGSEIRLGYLMHEIESRLESLLEYSLIKELSKHSREEEYLRAFTLTRRSVQSYGTMVNSYDTMVNLYHTYNDKFLNIVDALVKYSRNIGEELCKEPLKVETNAVSDIKSFYELLTEICGSTELINFNLDDVNEIIKILLQAIEV